MLLIHSYRSTDSFFPVQTLWALVLYDLPLSGSEELILFGTRGCSQKTVPDDIYELRNWHLLSVTAQDSIENSALIERKLY